MSSGYNGAPQRAAKAHNHSQDFIKKIDNAQTQTATVNSADPSVRKRIRDFLDGHFDEQKGSYLDGYSDEKAGTQLQIPWAWVKDYREFAYGPLKVDPALSELLEKLKQAQEAMQADIDALSEKWNATINALTGKINAAIKGK